MRQLGLSMSMGVPTKYPIIHQFSLLSMGRPVDGETTRINSYLIVTRENIGKNILTDSHQFSSILHRETTRFVALVRKLQDLVNPVHGSNDPAPVAGAVASGPGQFRNYTADTRYLESDPLRHGLDTKQARTSQNRLSRDTFSGQSSRSCEPVWCFR